MTGTRDYPGCSTELAAQRAPGDRLSYRLVPFEEHMEVVYTEATLVVSRSGGMTAELTTVGMPSVLVPLPGAPGDHQTANADALVAAGAAVKVPDAELDPARLAAEIDALLADPVRLGAMSRGRAHPRPARRHRAVRRPGRGDHEAGDREPASGEQTGGTGGR